jgi:hypothetical protein
MVWFGEFRKAGVVKGGGIPEKQENGSMCDENVRKWGK